MSAKPPSATAVSDVVWLCRRLASALQDDRPVLCALDTAAEGASAGLAKALRAMRQSVRAGGRVSEAMEQLGWPSFVWGMARHGEAGNKLPAALDLVADTLEAEQAWAPPRDRALHAYAVALGRLGVMVGTGVPVLTAIETAAAAVPQSQAHDVLMAARKAVRHGADLSDALRDLAPALPEATFDMISDAEREGRLGEALPIIADYLCDEAGESPRRGRKQEVHDA